MGPEAGRVGWLVMNNMTLLNRSGLAAIAAATVLLSTPALAQDAAPVTADPAPIVADTPLPAEPAPAEPTPDAASDPLAPAATTTTTITRTTRTTRPTRASAAPATRSVRAPAPTARPATAAPMATVAPAAPVVEATPAFDPAMVAPLPEPAAATPAPTAGDSLIENDLLPIAGAAGLGLLALAGAGMAMRRRRRRDEDVVAEDHLHEPVMTRPATAPVTAAAPVLATAPIAASAFNWGNERRETAPPANRIEAAKRGPTVDNPSLSLKKRLKRAAFFDQRDRSIAAGTGVRVSAMAGLPKGLAKPQAAAAAPVRRPDQGVQVSFGRTFQPA